MKRFFQKILTTAALSLAAGGLNSCTTLIDSGSMLDNVGKQEPSRLLEVENNRYSSWHKESPLVAWKKGEQHENKRIFTTAIPKNCDFTPGLSPLIVN